MYDAENAKLAREVERQCFPFCLPHREALQKSEGNTVRRDSPRAWGKCREEGSDEYTSDPAGRCYHGALPEEFGEFGTWAQPTGRRKHAPTDRPAILGWLTHTSPFNPGARGCRGHCSLPNSLSLVQALGHAMGFHSSENGSFH